MAVSYDLCQLWKDLSVYGSEENLGLYSWTYANTDFVSAHKLFMSKDGIFKL